MKDEFHTAIYIIINSCKGGAVVTRARTYLLHSYTLLSD